MSFDQDSSAHVPNIPNYLITQRPRIDWEAIGKSVVNVSVAMLGKQAAAGIDALTVIVGQAIGLQIPIRDYGIKVLKEALSGLSCCKSYGDILWFGLSAEHIIWLIADPPEGASLVALCAALSEGHNLSTSSLIMCELAMQTGNPNGLSPSYAQWQALVKVCSSAFCHTTLSFQIEQFLRLGGYTDDMDFSRWPGHPQDMARIILALGDVTAGRLPEISIRGGPACSWVAAYADFVLGLRVAVMGNQTPIPSTNFDESTKKAQVSIQFYNGVSKDGEMYNISNTGVIQTFFLRGGVDFGQRYFSGYGYFTKKSSVNGSFLGGRLSWVTMLRDTFGRDAEDLLREPPEPYDNPQLGGQALSPIKEVMEINAAFLRFFVAGAAFYAYVTTESGRYTNVQEFIISATHLLPELSHLKVKLLLAAGRLNASRMPSIEICSEYLKVRHELVKMCNCSEHVRTALMDKHARKFCLARVAEACLWMSYLTGRLRLNDIIHPRRLGILRLYEDTRAFSKKFDGNTDKKQDFIASKIIRDSGDTDLCFLFSTYITLFSGEPLPYARGKSVSAMSDGKIYCFIDTVRELSDSYKKASVVNVGAGSVMVGCRLHYAVYDGKINENRTNGYDAKHVVNSTYGEILTNLEKEDYTSPHLRVATEVNDRIGLEFWYRFSHLNTSHEGQIVISPGSFVKCTLTDAIRFKSHVICDPTTDSTDENPDDPSWKTIVVRGEGVLRSPYLINAAIFVRPHFRNIWGRCVALATSRLPVALINSAEDFKHFSRIFEMEQGQAERRPRAWTLV